MSKLRELAIAVSGSEDEEDIEITAEFIRTTMTTLLEMNTREAADGTKFVNVAEMGKIVYDIAVGGEG